MSRCFPFPPPGYENKARSDHVDLLAKEKHKEKQHKKEKKDREKREGKERKDKDRSKDKHKEKKNNKEKHKDKKKDKDRDKDKNRSSEDRRTEVQGDHEVKLGDSSQGAKEVKDSKFTEEFGKRIRDDEKGATNSRADYFTGSIQRKAEGISSQGAQEVKDSKFTEEFGKRIRDEEKGATNSRADYFTGSIQRKAEGMGAAVAMEKGRVTVAEMASNSIGASETRNDGLGRSVHNFAGSIKRIDCVGSANAMENKGVSSINTVANLTAMEKKRNHGVGCTVDKPISSMQERFQVRSNATAEKERGANKVSNPISATVPNLIRTEQTRNHGMGRPVDNIVPRRVEGIGTVTAVEKERGKNNSGVSYPIGTMQGRNGEMVRPVENLTSSISTSREKEKGKGGQMAANLVGTEQRRNNGMGVSVEKDTVKSMERKEKTRDRETDDSKGDRNGDRDRNEKKNKGKYKDRYKEKEKEEEKMREKGEHMHKKENDKLRDDGKMDLLGGPNIKPLAPHKDDANITVTDGNTKKRKESQMNGYLHENNARPPKFPRTNSSSHLPLENGRTLELCHITAPSISHGSTNNIISGVLSNKEHKINGITEPRPSSVDLKPPVALNSRDNKVRLKPPHPDSKYLSQIFCVPKMEEWPEFDDQEWLFSSDNHRPKPKAKIDFEEETPQVWADAMQIESADVMALPYVIPF